MKNDCVMPLGNLINKLLRGEADEWCETDFRFYLESLTHGDKTKLEQVLKTVDEAIINWKSLFFISRYEDKIKEWKEGKCGMGEVDELYFEEELWRKEGKRLLTAQTLYAAISSKGFINDYHRDAMEKALDDNDIRFLKMDWENMMLAQIRVFRDVVVSSLGVASSKPVNDKGNTGIVLKKLEDYPEEFGIKLCSEFTGYAIQTLYKLTSKGEIPCYRRKGEGRAVFFYRDEIREWKMARRQGTNEEYVEEMNEMLAARTAHFYNNPNKLKK